MDEDTSGKSDIGASGQWVFGSSGEVLNVYLSSGKSATSGKVKGLEGVVKINSAKDARAMIGKIVYWDARDSERYYGDELSGELQDVAGKNVLIDNDWKWRPFLRNFRTESKNAQPDKQSGNATQAK